jgi:hypothetical protein
LQHPGLRGERGAMGGTCTSPRERNAPSRNTERPFLFFFL